MTLAIQMTLQAKDLDSFASFKSDFATIGKALPATRISLSVVRTTLPATWMILPTMEIVLDSFELISCMQSNEKVRSLWFFLLQYYVAKSPHIPTATCSFLPKIMRKKKYFITKSL